MRTQTLLATLLAAALAAGAAQAGKVYRWTDRNGVVHYGDRPPAGATARATGVAVVPVQAEPGAIVRLRVERQSDHYVAYADNTLSGPVEVMLHFTRHRNVAGEPALPARATVPARGSARVSRLVVADPAQDGEFELRLDGMPGDPAARALDVEYLPPLAQSSLRVGQGYGGRFSHVDPPNRYALDFAADEGTAVLAARAGTVMQVASDFDRAGLNREKYGGRANFIRILHDDGSMALYAHLQADGVLVRAGQKVRAGQRIGLSGNTGFTTGPHLHFAVQVNRGMRLQSVPFRMRGVPAVRAAR